SSDDLDSIRQGIDRVDATILELLAQRRAFSQRAARLKGATGSPSRDLLREEDLIADRITEALDYGIDAGLVNTLWREIIDDSVRVQRQLLGRAEIDRQTLTIAIQGIAGSYSWLASRHFFAARGITEPTFQACATFSDAFDAVSSGTADVGVLPIENTTAGAISEVYDLLLESGLHVIGDTRFRVRHCLLGVPGATVGGLRKIYAHPQAAAQCSEFLSRLDGCEVIVFGDTALSGKEIARIGDPTIGAIASEEAGRLFGLEVLHTGVANRDHNYTRFVVVSPTEAHIPAGVPAKTSIVIAVGNHPGALVDALAVFTEADINLIKLESRPIPDTPSDELFYLDFEGAIDDPVVAGMLDTLTTHVHYLKVLGSYPSRDLRPRPATTPIDPMPGRAEVDQPASPKPATGYRLGSRTHKGNNTVIEVGAVRLGEDPLVVIAGPCAVESWDQVMAAARAVKESGGRMLRGGCFKPRTSPYSFQGLGFEGLEMLAEAGKAFGLPIVTEVTSPEDVPAVAASADVLQIGTRNMQNFSLLSAVGRSHRPVMLKRGMSSSLDEWLQAAEYILAEGNQQVFLCERGIRTFETSTRNTLDLSAVPVLMQRTHLPVIVDPSHAAGERSLVGPLARAAVAVGAHGIMVEIHPDPEAALSDGPQSLDLAQFERLMLSLGVGRATPS
ncbi:MAG TPA: bifunctional 3-deoxy-7-phosphoheptulonate synthase/chorismate mutase, partial [Acidimicrobiia bacterium]